MDNIEIILIVFVVVVIGGNLLRSALRLHVRVDRWLEKIMRWPNE